MQRHFIILITIGVFINRLFLIYIHFLENNNFVTIYISLETNFIQYEVWFITKRIYWEKHIWLKALIYYIVFEKDKCHLVCQKLVESMPSRCQIIITNGWDWIHIYRINFFFLRYIFEQYKTIRLYLLLFFILFNEQ